MMNLANPSKEYRPAPFWSWNDELEPEELRRQIREMKAAGLGGFFMHARGGLKTRYLSPAWMECVCACLDEAQKQGMNGWLYDENGWPSGFGGGLVNGLGEKYQQKYLRHEIMDASAKVDDSRTIGYYSEDGCKYLGMAIPGGYTGKVLRCFYEVNLYYVDNLDLKVTLEFIRVTHQHYYENLPEKLRSALKGIFTDEPQLSRNGIPWSLVLEEEFRKAYGEEILPVLPGLFCDAVPNCRALRAKFWRLCGILFRDHFLKPIYEWCDAHGWMLTGHHVLEENATSQIPSNGSIMPQYQYYMMPGMDHLGRQYAAPVAAIQLASAAAQYGKKQILSESFALTGWNCNFTGQRWIYHYQMAHGVNFLCQHLEGYTLRGLRKRDYPSSAFYHQPWWQDYSRINDWFSRVGMLLAEGKQKVDVLVIHSLSSTWLETDGFEQKPDIKHYDYTFYTLNRALDGALIEHHYADEIIAEEVGSVEGDTIRLGLCSYNLVVIPPLQNLSGKICRMLKEYMAAGGKILRQRDLSGDRPLHIDGVLADQATLDWFATIPAYDEAIDVAAAILTLKPEIPCLLEFGIKPLADQSKLTGIHTWEEIKEAYEEPEEFAEDPNFSMPAWKMVMTHRIYDDLDGRRGVGYFFATLKYEDATRLHFSLPATGKTVEILDQISGNFKQLSGVEIKDGRMVFDYTVDAADAVFFFVPEQTDDLAPVYNRQALYSNFAVARIPDVMRIKKASPNLLTLDTCEYRIDDQGDWEKLEVISLQARLLRYKRDLRLAMRFAFEVSDNFDLSTQLTLICENPEKCQFALNGVAFDGKEVGYMFDKAFRQVQMPSAALKHGDNILEITMLYHQSDEVYVKLEKAKIFESEYNNLAYDTEIESVYLSGDFTVRHIGTVETLPRHAMRYNGKFVIDAPESVNVNCSDLLQAGYPFFAGRMVLETHAVLTEEEVKAIKVLRFNPDGANSWRIKINGKYAGECYWAPYAIAVDGLLKMGDNEIEIELATSLRNLLGPHHEEEGEDYFVHTMSFNREPNYIGYAAPPYNEGYCFVKLGIHDLVFLG